MSGHTFSPAGKPRWCDENRSTTAKLFWMLLLCWAPSILHILLLLDFILYIRSLPSPLWSFSCLHSFTSSCHTSSTPLLLSPITDSFSACPPTSSWWAWRLDAAGPTLWLRCRCGARWLTPALLPRKGAWCWLAQRKLWVWRKQQPKT